MQVICLGTSGKAILEGGSDDKGASAEAQGRAIIDVLGREKRNEVLAAVYMVRSDVSLTVQQAALHVWKTVVANTPKTLKEIMPVKISSGHSSCRWCRCPPVKGICMQKKEDRVFKR